MTRPRRPKGSGSIRQLPSGRQQATFKHDGQSARRTFDTKAAAQAWLNAQEDAARAGAWTPPAPVIESKAPKFADYAASWLANRDLAPRTRHEYQGHLDKRLLPTFGTYRLDRITVTMVDAWWASLPATRARQHAYGVLHAILRSAWKRDLIPAVPARVEGAFATKRTTAQADLPTASEVLALAAAMPSTKYRAMVLLAAWCGLRFGELTELRRDDVVILDGVPVVIRVRRAVSRVGKTFVIGDPKGRTEVAVRDVTIPPHIRCDVAYFLAGFDGGPADLLFPGTRTGGHMPPHSLHQRWYTACKRVGVPGLRWHDLRHYAGTTAAQTGATTREIQARLGHSTHQASMRYQHAAAGRDEVLAERLSQLA